MTKPFPLKATGYTPKGELWFVKIDEPVLKMDAEDSEENYQYQLVLRLAEKEAEELLARMNATVEAAGFPLKSLKTRKFDLRRATQRVEDENGELIKEADGTFVKEAIEGMYDFNFSQFAYRRMKDGTFEKRELPVYDSHADRVDPQALPKIGNGSVGRVALYPNSYSIGGKNGVKFYLSGVQLTELVEGSGGVDIHFPEEEGFTVAKDTVAEGFKAEAVKKPTVDAPSNVNNGLDDEIPFALALPLVGASVLALSALQVLGVA